MTTERRDVQQARQALLTAKPNDRFALEPRIAAGKNKTREIVHYREVHADGRTGRTLAWHCQEAKPNKPGFLYVRRANGTMITLTNGGQGGKNAVSAAYDKLLREFDEETVGRLLLANLLKYTVRANLP